jgi:photosystem II stability/assembly factor-like uncharacterized protein
MFRVIKNLLYSLLFLFSSFNLAAQPEFRLMIDAGTYKVEEVQQSAEAWFENRPQGRGSGFNQYKRWEYMALRMMNEDGYLKSPEFYIEELQRFNAELNLHANNRAMLNDNWVEMGPVSWNATSGWNPGVGRITAFSIDEIDEDHIIIGAETGGVWRTVDGGQNWTPLTDYFSNMFVYATAMEPGNPLTYYFGSTQGRIYKSTDSGSTWSFTGTAGNSLINKIVIHPNNPDLMFASSQNSGLYRSVNGGVSWTSIAADSRGYDIEFKPGDLNTVYVSGNFFHKSTDGGANFSTIGGFDNTGAKMIAVSGDNPNVVYVVEADGSIFGALYKSIDSGNSFTKLDHTGMNYFGYSLTGQDNLGQAPRDMDIVINPNNVNEVHIAGIHTWKSLDGGVSFVPTSHWVPATAAANNIGYNHADVDIMQFYGNTLYTGTDGGIFKATNTTNLSSNYYTDITEGLGIRQFYKIGVSQTDPVVISAGSQDNGTSFYTTTDGWRDWLGADGMETFVDKNNNDIMYGTTQFGYLYRTINGGLSFTGINSNAPGNWVTPFEQDPIVNNRIYAGYSRVYRSNNQGGSWTSVSQDFGGDLDHLKIAKSDNNTIYASRANLLFKTTTGDGTWQQLSGFTGLINSIAIHPTNPDKVAIATTATQKVYVSDNGGQTWSSYRLNLPNFQALALEWHDNGQDGLYLGMNYGVYYIDNTFSEWQVFNNNLPNVIINELEVNYAENKIYAGTYGRGLWVSPTYEPTLSTTDLNLFSTLSVYPVPANEVLNVYWNENYTSDLRLFDNTGKLIQYHREIPLFNIHQLDISNLNAGVYFLRINNEKGSTVRKIIIK